VSAAPVRVRVAAALAVTSIACGAPAPKIVDDAEYRASLSCGMVGPSPRPEPIPDEPPPADPSAPRATVPEVAAEGISVTQPVEARTETPFPIAVRVVGAVGVDRVVVRYKAFGGSQWKTLNLRQYVGFFGGEIDCVDLTAAGSLRYFVVAADHGGTPVAMVGSLTEPLRVPLTQKIEGPQPALPGRAPRPACARALEEPSERMDALFE